LWSGSALQLKLDELIRITQARNKLMGIEHLSESKLESVRVEIQQRKGANERSSTASVESQRPDKKSSRL
jgi:low affinity Fe/Cu permease